MQIVTEAYWTEFLHRLELCLEYFQLCRVALEQHLRSPEHKFVLKDVLVEILVDVKIRHHACPDSNGKLLDRVST